MKNSHINEDQLIYLVIDRAELPIAMENHLSECAVCQKKIKDLEEDLTQLETLAHKFTPGPRRTIRYEPEKSYWEILQPWFFRTSFAAAVMAILVIAFSLIPFNTFINDPQRADLTYEDLVDQQVMAGIWEFEEDYLMGSTVDIDEDTDTYLDGEFLDFILPLEEENNSA